MSDANNRAVSIEIDQETSDRIERLAEVRRRTPHSVMRDAISQYLEREENRDAFRQDAINAWDECQATGLHVSGEEVTTWLETWGDDNEQSAPECHK